MDFKKILFKTTSIDAEKALPDAVIFCDKEGKIQWVSDKAAEIFETSRMHLMTSNIADFIENPINLAITSVKNSKPVIAKLVSSEVYYDMTAKEIEDGYVFDIRDAVAPIQAGFELEAVDTPVNRDKNNFIIKLANDLKSPLQSIVGFSQAMYDGLGGNMSLQQEKYIKIINKNSSDLMYFIGKLIELSQTENSAKIPDNKTFDIISMINSVVKYNEQLYKDKELRWKINLAENMKNTVVSDDEILRAVLQNLLEVIIKSVEMGEVVINVLTPDEEFLQNRGYSIENPVLLNISCSSLLFSESDLDCLFDPYKIVDSSNRKNLLRAMILSCAKNLVKTLKGDIWVESMILKNTSFNIIIPQRITG